MTSTVTEEYEQIIIGCCVKHPQFMERGAEEIDKETKLIGKNSILDSLGVVGLLIDVEEQLSEKLDKPVSLLDEKAMSEKSSPFRSINTLAAYIESRFG